MTAWQSMFDAGACKVAVSIPSTTAPDPSSPLWSGVLAKGESSPVFSDGFGDNCQVSVDANGAVSLAFDAGTGSFEVDVFPQYDVSALQTQVTAISAPPYTNPQAAAYDDLGASQQSPDWAALTIADGGAASPDPVTFPAHASTSPPGAYVGVIVGFLS